MPGTGIDEPLTFDLSAMSRSELEAEIVHQANLIERFRSQIGGVVLGLEEEGDRTYFGSSNDADWLREIEQEMLASLNELDMPWMHGGDLYAVLKALKQENEASSINEDRLAQELFVALQEVGTFLGLLEKVDKLLDNLWEAVPWGQTYGLDIMALNEVPSAVKRALTSRKVVLMQETPDEPA